MAKSRPLALDVDGTFLRTDMLYECFWAGLGKHPLRTIGAVLRHVRHPARLKRELAELAELRTELLPVNEDVRQLAAEARGAGREVVLASASDAGLVQALAQDHGLSDRVFASNPGRNLKGDAKAEALAAAYAETGFDYAGNEHADRAVWDRARGAVIVGHHPGIARQLEAAGKCVTQVPSRVRRRDILRAMRPHQWVKNVLLFVPMIAAHDFTLQALALALIGIASFSAAASSIYVVNDLLDLEADRLHDTKHRRPFASGAVPIKTGMAVCVALCAISLGLAAALGLAFVGVVLGYMLASLAYSLKLKRLRWIDIGILAALYTIRVIAGAVAVEVAVSAYLLAFIFPAFLTLGCVKRLTELAKAKTDAPLPGRAYGRADRPAILRVALISAAISVLVYLAYSQSAHAAPLYPTRWLLWLAVVPLALWLMRMVRLGYMGRQDYDPIVFAMRDKMGLGLLMIMLSLMFHAAGLWQQWFG